MTPFILKKIIFLMFFSVFLMPLSTTEWTLTNSKSSGLGIWSSKILCRNIKNQGSSFSSPCVVQCKISQFNEKEAENFNHIKACNVKNHFPFSSSHQWSKSCFCFFCFFKMKKKKKKSWRTCRLIEHFPAWKTLKSTGIINEAFHYKLKCGLRTDS